MTTTIAPPPAAPARRSFLALLTGAAAVPIATALPAPAEAATATPMVEESPLLLQLGAQLEPSKATLLAEITRDDEARATLERTLPALPPEIVTDGREGRLAHLITQPDGSHKWVYQSDEIRSQIILREISGRTKEGRRLRRIARIAEVYEKAVREADDASNWYPAYQAKVAAAESCLQLIDKIAACCPITPAGAAILARATVLLPTALTAAGCEWKGQEAVQRLSQSLAGALLRNGTQGGVNA